MSVAAADPLAAEAAWRRSTLPAPPAGALAMTLCESLAQVAARQPEQLAIVSAAGRVSFGDLLGQVGALAAAIRAAAAPPGPVALLLPAGMGYIAAWFACAAAGRPMLMVELANPPARNAALLAAAGAALVLHDGDAAAVQAAGAIPALSPEFPLAPMPLIPGGLDAAVPAFLFATSGSSGQPKLVVYAQETVQAKVQCSAMVMGVEPGDTVMIAGSHANFGVLHHALVFLFRGGTLCLHDMREGGLSGMFGAIARFGVNHLRFTPSLFRTVAAMPEAAPALRQAACIRFAGEPLLRGDIALARAHLPPACAVQNLYGSTESMIFFWSDRTEALPPGALVPNGRIYPVAEFLLLDEAGRPAAEGEAGELVISSRLNALGDWVEGRVDATRFPPDPRGGGRRLYHTGDVVRLLPDGCMVVQGRRDRLLKVNGQRVSLLEIEATLRGMPGCAQVSVQPRDQAGATQLVAFLVMAPGAPADPGAWLAARLPRYMVPARFLAVQDLPLLPGGKVDGRALLALLPADPAPFAPAPPAAEDGLAAELQAAWARILGVATVEPSADFFALGGDSLKLLDLTLAVERHTGRPLSPAAFLGDPTPRGLARLLARQAAPTSPAPPIAPPLPGHFQAAGRVTLQRLRHARGLSKGVVLGMPSFRGHLAPVAMLAANALPDHEIWGFSAELDDRTLLDDAAWLACAEEIARQMAAMDWLRPDALVGYSVAGYLAWLVDRILATGAWRPGRVIAIDAYPVHPGKGAAEAAMQALVAGSADRPGRMLLVGRRPPMPFTVLNDSASRWHALGVPFQALGLPTLDHADLNRPEAIRLAAPALAAFVETGAAPAWALPGAQEFATPGGQLHRLLAAGVPPPAEAVRQLMAEFGLPWDPHCQLALLFLAIAVGEHAPALDLARQLAGGRSYRRGTTYALVGLLGVKGQVAEAAAVAEAWCRERGEDSAVRGRIPPAWRPPQPWAALARQPIGSAMLFDLALDWMAAREGVAA
ncbi:non-ribosomal peptide synthetase [Falsiroseomonas selenitidurans]|uniref:AMP-binding protein n=1 Tax=Falsiroseomonas selenitidurans TaxID=2716335 RepID=A0ABX1E9R2_9PROT|nr:non-ribosomal peptide synthetase [Falsiroseomonas selenitidurans]NKC33932.1 AMP-binding protein [Falsiroseomonas selenitidurans]